MHRKLYTSLCVFAFVIILASTVQTLPSDAHPTKRFDAPGAVYVPLHGVCKFHMEEDAQFMLRMKKKIDTDTINKVVEQYVTKVKDKGGEICDLNKGLRCQHRLYTPKDEIDVEALIRRKNDQVDPDGGGIVISGLEKIQKSIHDNTTLNVLSTCRCNPLDSQLFAGECLVRAGLPCKFSSLFPSRRCTQNADCVGGIENLENDFEGYSNWPVYTRLVKLAAINTCKCLFGFTRTSGRECLKGKSSPDRHPTVPLVVAVSTFLVSFQLTYSVRMQ